MERSELRKIIKQTVKEQMGIKPTGITHTVPEVVIWIDKNIDKKERVPIHKRFLHALEFWNDCGGAAGGCPMPN